MLVYTYMNLSRPYLQFVTKIFIGTIIGIILTKLNSKSTIFLFCFFHKIKYGKDEKKKWSQAEKDLASRVETVLAPKNNSDVAHKDESNLAPQDENSFAPQKPRAILHNNTRVKMRAISHLKTRPISQLLIEANSTKHLNFRHPRLPAFWRKDRQISLQAPNGCVSSYKRHAINHFGNGILA